MTYSESVGWVNTNQNALLSVSQWNPALGTLTGVELSLDAKLGGASDGYGSVSVTTGAQPSTFINTLTWSMQADVSLAGQGAMAAYAVSDTFDNTPVGVTIDLKPASPNTTYTYRTVALSDGAAFSPADLGAFQGLGTLDFLFLATVGDNTSVGTVGLGSPTRVSLSTQTFAQVTVTYTYDEDLGPPQSVVPLPAAVWLIGLAFLGHLGIGLGRREAAV